MQGKNALRRQLYLAFCSGRAFLRVELPDKVGENLRFYKTGALLRKGEGLILECSELIGPLKVAISGVPKRVEGFLSIVFWENRNQVNFTTIWGIIQEYWPKK